MNTAALLSMTFEQYAESMEDWLATYFDEQYWEGGLNVNDCFDLILEYALQDGIEITDLETVNYDAILSNWYACTEKGLS